MTAKGLSGNALKVIATVAIGRSRGDFYRQMLWMMLVNRSAGKDDISLQCAYPEYKRTTGLSSI